MKQRPTLRAVLFLSLLGSLCAAGCGRNIKGKGSATDEGSGGSSTESGSGGSETMGSGGLGGAPPEGSGGSGGKLTEGSGGSGGELTECDDDEFETRPPSATSDRQCTRISTCAPGEFEEEEPSATSDRFCTECPTGTFSTEENAAACTKWSPCQEGKLESIKPNAERDRVCNSCGADLFEDKDGACQALTVCADEEYESTPAGAERDRICTPLTVCDGATQFESKAPSATSDRVCSTLTTCAPGTSATQPTATSDRVCTPCEDSYSTTENAEACIAWSTNCQKNEFVSVQPSSLSDRACQACPSGTFSAGPNAESCQGISAGWMHACTLDTADGVVHCWGDNTHGQLTMPAELDGVEFTSVSAGAFHTCAVRRDTKKIACWGLETGGQLSVVNELYQGVSAGAYHTCGHLETGGVRCWGAFGAPITSTDTFTKISSGGWDHTCGLRDDGSISCFGDTDYDQDLVPEGTYIDVDTWGFGGCGVLTDKSTICWGGGIEPWFPVEGSFESLSVGFGAAPTYPVEQAPPTLSNPYACGMLADGTIACNENVFYSPPWPPMEFLRLVDMGFTAISIGKDFGCGIVKSDGKITCWGWDEPVYKTGRTTPPDELRH